MTVPVLLIWEQFIFLNVYVSESRKQYMDNEQKYNEGLKSPFLLKMFCILLM